MKSIGAPKLSNNYEGMPIVHSIIQVSDTGFLFDRKDIKKLVQSHLKNKGENSNLPENMLGND